MKALFKPFALATLYGIVAVMAIWALATAAGVDFTVSTLGMPIPAPAFVIFSIFGGLGAWVVSAMLLKTKTPRKTGQLVGWLVLIASIATPLSGTSDLMAMQFQSCISASSGGLSMGIVSFSRSYARQLWNIFVFQYFWLVDRIQRCPLRWRRRSCA
jgi:hypothetical protein